MAAKLALVSVPAPPRPDPVIVTFAVAVVSVPPVAYCTVIVQLPPAATTVPDAQVPPVIEKVPVPVTRAIVGAAVRVSGAVAPAALLTVIVPVFVAVVAGVVVSAGTGAEMDTVAPVTVNVTAALNAVVPCGVVTVTPRAASAAPGAMVKVAVTLVPAAFTAMPLAVIPAPAFTAVAPNKSTPVMVTPTLVPRAPELGVMADSDGPATVKGTVLLVPAGVETLTLRTPAAAPAVMVNVAVTVVAVEARPL